MGIFILFMSRKQRNLICSILILIMFFIGMCSIIERTDSLSSFSQLTLADSDTLEAIKHDTILIYSSGNKLITTLRDTFLRTQRNYRTFNLRNYAEFLWIKEILQILSILSVTTIFISEKIEYSKQMILTYIHNQDGEK